MKKVPMKLIIIISSILVLSGVGYYFYNDYAGGTDYYVKVTTDPINKEKALDDKNVVQGVVYTYEMTGYDKEANEKLIEFTVHKERPLKKNAYIKILMNPKRGPLSWEEVKESELPDPVKKKLN
ncbi:MULTISPECIES: YxeA family protein [Vagococcus]|uniref:YxeA family protein n=1 Tax=Vagococcus fluvialis bH819 TaxID=1255619 RepID=A0A1X6WQ14_9ENTE|nr:MULTISPECIES: YxeA family protein [Vagococcus]SLM86375.1 hypothetical protein FM121_09810 [Vagococcus fluvialis bH819]HCM89029.1 YxeA family protein [Vagococcus sp.]